MKRQRYVYPVKLMARVLGVSRSGFYAWMRRLPSARKLQDDSLKPLIRIAHDRSRETYGPKRLQTELTATGTVIGRDRISRLRKEMGLRCAAEVQGHDKLRAFAASGAELAGSELYGRGSRDRLRQ